MGVNNVARKDLLLGVLSNLPKQLFLRNWELFH